MMEVSLILQKAVGARLVGSEAVTDLVPADNIFDRNGRPERFPCIILGEGQTAREELTLADDHLRVFATLHIWTRDGDLVSAREIAGVVVAALKGRFFGDLVAVQARHRSSRFMRDPDGSTSHGVIDFEFLVREVSL